MVGSLVKHRTHGKGTVTALTDKIITVEFANCVSKFEYPKAFENYLTCDDKEIQTQILKLVEEINRQKEAEARQAEELRRKKQAQKKQTAPTTRKTTAPKQIKRENVAFKCTYCDGGKTKNCIGFKGLCSKENIDVNISNGRRWCSHSQCSRYYNGEISRKELTEICKEEGFVCYECRTLLDWKFSVGWTEAEYDENEEIIKESKPKRINRIMPGSLAVLTTRLPEFSENERVIFAVFLVDESYDGDDSTEGYVIADSTYKIAFTKEEANQLPFWSFYRNSGNTENARWGTGLFRYISDDIAANILKRASEIKTKTRDEKLALEFFEHFCKTHGMDSDNLPECEGAIKIKS